MVVQKTKFRGKQNILEKTVWNPQIADDAGIEYHKLEKTPLAADGTVLATAHLNLDGFRIICASEPIDDTDLTNKCYVDNLPANGQIPADYVIHYIKDTSGAPHGTADDDELCLNINDKSLYKYSSGAWNLESDNLPVGMRFLFALSGTDTSGLSGIYHATNFIYKVKPAGQISDKLVKSGVLIVIRNQSKDAEINSGWVYDGIYNLWRPLAGSGGSSSPGSGAILPGRGLIQEVSTFHVNVDNYTIFVNGNNEIVVSPDFIKSSISDYLVAGEGIHLNQIDTPTPNSNLEIEVYQVDGGEWTGSPPTWFNITPQFTPEIGYWDGTVWHSESGSAPTAQFEESGPYGIGPAQHGESVFLNYTGALTGTVIQMRAVVQPQVFTASQTEIMGGGGGGPEPTSITWSWPNVEGTPTDSISQYTPSHEWITSWPFSVGMRFESMAPEDHTPFTIISIEVLI